MSSQPWQQQQQQQQSRRIEERNAQILACRKKMRECKDKSEDQHRSHADALSRLEAERRRETLLAALECEPRTTWLGLTDDERHDKELVLKAAECNVFCSFPWRGPWENDEIVPPDEFLSDRDFILAFVARKDFQRETWGDACDAPVNLRDDKEVMLAICGKCCRSLEFASPSLRDDPELVLAALNEDAYYSMETFVHASDRLKSDREFIMKVISDIDNEDDDRYEFYKWLKFVKLGIEDEKKVASALREKLRCIKSSWITEVLELFSPSLRDDKEFMLDCVSSDWRAMEFCSDRLKSCDDIVKAATSQSNNRAMKWAMGAFREEYLSTRSKILVLEELSAHEICWDDVPDDMRGDPDIVIAAVESGAVQFEDLPEELRSDRGVIFAAAGSILNPPEEDFFDLIPDRWRRDKELAMTLFRNEEFSCPDTIGTVLEYQPSLYKSKEAALAIAKMWISQCGVIASIIEKFVTFHDDGEVMLAACKNESECFEHVSDRLRSDRRFVEKLLRETEHGWVLCYLSTEFCKANIDLVVKAIELFDDDDFSINTHALEGLWDHKLIVMACLKKGVRALEYLFLEAPSSSILDDEEVIRSAIRIDPSQLQYASNRLKNDRCFILSLVGICGRSLKYASMRLKVDDEVLISAVANDADTVLRCFRSEEDDFGFLVGFASRVRARLALHDTYVQTFLCGISVPRSHNLPAMRCHLTMLDRGSDTSAGFKRLIAKFLGVPLKNELHLLRGASSNLAKLGY